MNKCSISYIHDFIFKQKCIPWRVIESWKRAIESWRRIIEFWKYRIKSGWVQERWNRFQVKAMSKFILRDILLENLFTGGFNGDKQFDYAHTPPERWHPNYLLKESPHVKFLQHFKNTKEVNQEEFKNTEYFCFGAKDIRIYGDFFEISDEERLIERANTFLSLYRAVRDKTNGKNFIFFPGDCYPKNCFMKVSKIPKSKYYLIREGHHRFASYYVLGYKTVKVRIIGLSKIP
ncbi:hypothetical protein EPN16_02575, partial [bacterium]